jgi:mannose-6-phosphate isomerase-like protein (cupin superfamily)
MKWPPEELIYSKQRLILMNRLCTCLIFGCLAVARGIAQSPGVETFSSEQVSALEKSLRAEADRSNGTATGPIAKYPGFYTMLVFRDKGGEVEIHNQFDEIMIVVGGKATVVTGGTPQNVRTLKPGELRGTSIEGGMPNPMEKGNMVHIPVNTPHQVFVPAGGSVTYIDVKIEHPKS